MTGDSDDYPPPQIHVSGGAGGTTARTEDLELAAWAVEAAAREVEEAARQVRMAELWAEEAIPKAIEQVRPAVMEAQRAAYNARVQVGGFADMALELEDVAARVAAVGRAYEEAEASAYQGVSMWTRIARGTADAFGLGVWAQRTLLGSMLRFSPIDWASRAGGGEGLASAIRPDAFPPITGLLNGATAEMLAAQLDAPGPIPGVTYDSVLWLLSRSTSILERLAGEPIYSGVVLESDKDSRPRPQGVEDLMQNISEAPYGDHGGVYIDTVSHPDGTRSHMVLVPGTQDATLSDASTNDWDSNLYLTRNQPSDVAQMVRDAIEMSDIEPQDQIMIAGHSQGGGVAAFLAASDLAEDYSIPQVVTFGSAPHRIPHVDGTSYLQMETGPDPTPGADGKPPPDLPNVTSVVGDLRGAEDPELAALATSVPGAHSYRGYQAVARAVDESADPSLVAWRDGASHFFGEGQVTRQVYRPSFEQPSSPATPATPLGQSVPRPNESPYVCKSEPLSWTVSPGPVIPDIGFEMPRVGIDVPSVGGVLPLRP